MTAFHNDRFVQVFGLALFGIGLLLFGICALWFKSTSDFIAASRVAEGRVVELTVRRGGGSSRGGVHYPVVEYLDEQGLAHSFQSSSGTNPPQFAVGERVEVLYTPGEPSSATIKAWFPLWGGMSITAAVGGGFFLFGFFILLAVVLGKLRRPRRTGRGPG
jgi:hypothetical protein